MSGVLRTEDWTDVFALVVSIVAFTALCGLCVRCYYNAEDDVDSDGGEMGSGLDGYYTPVKKTLTASIGKKIRHI